MHGPEVDANILKLGIIQIVDSAFRSRLLEEGAEAQPGSEVDRRDVIMAILYRPEKVAGNIEVEEMVVVQQMNGFLVNLPAGKEDGQTNWCPVVSQGRRGFGIGFGNAGGV